MMTGNLSHRWVCIAAPFISLLLLCSCEKKSNIRWTALGKNISEWKCVKLGKQKDSLNVVTPFINGSQWEFTFIDSIDSLPGRICWMAPDVLEFELLLNDKILVKTESTLLWPSSFSPDSILIYSNDRIVRPFVIDRLVFSSLLKKGENKLLLKIRSVNTEVFNVEQCGLYFETTDTRRSFEHPALSKHIYKQSLPRVDISSDNFSITNEPKTDAWLSVHCTEDKDGCEDLQRNIKIEVRGFSSSLYPKKQYSLRIAGDSLKKEKVSLLGMGASRKWILQGPYSDLSLVRNAFVYEMWKKMGYWSPESRFVELVLNGTYQGIYLLMERVEIADNRLHLQMDTVDADAFLVQINRPDKYDTILHAGGLQFILHDPPKVKRDEKYQARVTASLNGMATAFRKPLSTDFPIDWNSFADFMLVQEIVKNVDAYKVSSYIHKNDDRIDPRIVAGPVWDFDLSVGSSNINFGDQTVDWIYARDKTIPGFWRQFSDDEAFREKLKERYKKWRSEAWNDEHITNTLDSLVQLMGSNAIEQNFIRFPVLGKKQFISYSNVPASHAEEIAKMKSWLHDRLLWMDEQFGVQGIFR